MRRAFIIAAATLAIASCATKPDPVIVYRTQTVEVPVKVRCKADILLPRPPIATKEALTGAENIQVRVELLIAQLYRTTQRNAELQAALNACTE